MKREVGSRSPNNFDNQSSDDHDKGGGAEHIWRLIRSFWKGFVPGLIVGACVTYFASRGGFNMQGFLVKPKKGLFKPPRRQPTTRDIVNLPPPADRMEMGTKQITVQDGDSLWAIIARNMGEYNSENRFRVEKMNHDILGNNPELLRPGMTLTVPNYISRNEYRSKLNSTKVNSPANADVGQPFDIEPADNEVNYIPSDAEGTIHSFQGIHRVAASDPDSWRGFDSRQDRTEMKDTVLSVKPEAPADWTNSIENQERDDINTEVSPFPRG